MVGKNTCEGKSEEKTKGISPQRHPSAGSGQAPDTEDARRIDARGRTHVESLVFECEKR